jgi:hypothetical protein
VVFHEGSFVKINPFLFIWGLFCPRSVQTSLTQNFLKGTVSRDFLLQVFFMHHLPPWPLKITSGSFRIFSKTHGDIRMSRCTTGINDTGGKLCHQFLCLEYENTYKQNMFLMWYWYRWKCKLIADMCIFLSVILDLICYYCRNLAKLPGNWISVR